MILDELPVINGLPEVTNSSRAASEFLARMLLLEGAFASSCEFIDVDLRPMNGAIPETPKVKMM